MSLQRFVYWLRTLRYSGFGFYLLLIIHSVPFSEVIDDHLGFIARNADDLANLELGLHRLEQAARTPDSVIERMVEEICEERVFSLREAA